MYVSLKVNYCCKMFKNETYIAGTKPPTVQMALQHKSIIAPCSPRNYPGISGRTYRDLIRPTIYAPNHYLQITSHSRNKAKGT